MNNSTMNTIAIGFAAFAAWYALKPKTGSTGPSIAEYVFGTAAAQRREVGDATAANGAYVGSLTSGTSYAADFTSQYAKRQGVPVAAPDILGHTADYYAFNPSYSLT